MGGCLFLAGQPRTLPQGARPQGSPMLGVPFNLWVHPLMQNYQIWRGKWCSLCRVWFIWTLYWSQFLTHISPHFNGHFPGEPGLAGVYWSKGWWRWWVVTTGAISRAKLQSNHHHQLRHPHCYTLKRKLPARLEQRADETDTKCSR